MTATRMNSRAAVGSSQWVKEEREQMARLIDQDVEEFGYSARNELEWLNEHMAEIFSSNQMNVTDVFKTPGKLRGKTPRTARKHDAQRAPLTDLFAPNPQSVMSPARTTPFYQKVSKINVASYDDSKPSQVEAATLKSPLKQGKENADSGYHGMTEDEMDVDAPAGHKHKEALPLPRAPAMQDLLTVEARTTEESFVSAQEGLEPQETPQQQDQEDDDNATVQDGDLDDQRAAINAQVDGQHLNDPEISIHEDAPDDSPDIGEGTPIAREHTDSGSYTSSPEKTLPRKSSLNFASLPPRETLTGKRSMGVRNSQFQPSQQQNSQAMDMDEDVSDGEEREAGKSASLSSVKAQSKTSTQLLHEKINMLGQTREPRPSKSIPSMYPHLSQASQATKESQPEAENDDEDDSWIAPIEDRNSTHKAPEPEAHSRSDAATNGEYRRTYGHQKSISTSNIASPTKLAMRPEDVGHMAVSASMPNGVGNQATTPTSSPKKFTEGPLSASKARFYSVLKSAKGMFASSAGASAQAKMEATSLHTAASKESLLDSGPDTLKIPGGFADDAASVSTGNTAGSRPLSAFFSPSKEGRKTRSSTESDKRKKAKEEQKIVDDLDKIRQKERQKATQQKQERERAEEERKAQLERERAEATAREEERSAAIEKEQSQEQTQEIKTMPSTGKLRAPGRLAKPTRQAPAQSSKPVPVNIRVASQAQRLGSTQPSASTSVAETAQTPGNRPQSVVGRPGLTRGGSANPTSNARVKALEAAARKKEQEEKAAARKAEQKKELERKRAAKLEEERKADQERRAEEQRKVLEARAAAQKQAEQRKLEQQRREAAAAKARADAELAEALEREKARAAAPPQRGDVPGTIRQLTKTTVIQDMQANKSVKRPLQRDAEEPSRTSTMNRGLPSYQQQDAKRRRTDDEEDLDMRERHSVMAPPKRPSNMRKETLGNKFPHGYAHAPPPAAHHAQNNIYKASVTSHSNQMKPSGPTHPTETIKLSTARIPFADADTAPSKTPTASAFKTPARPAAPFATTTKPSPAYPNGDNIALPEIHDSDSDSSDSESESQGKPGFRAPSWVASPALRDLLTQQQLVDPESVFGPIAALNMDDVFRGGSSKNQERMRRYRERGESALWTESGDAVTSAEKRRDREARERVVRDGGWTFTRDL
ncbi:hypothetical protein K461DRAFT_296884 [Myriangium duriaei CBS 260.36]|uniref:Inner centromere protein ARK-binding domain-containing protein n=1 Tax=Myriangium duriaei CBS 260.36 TaxID=1168546 RepID=A0A9P4MDP8_9PEZI|nr:hypothetical protein K461DRAFT_296884 [Myriangium duriaei CBS 260.36]